jgi:two-component system, OmpR family, response regulator
MTTDSRHPRSGRILIIDDDPRVLDLGGRLLKRAGYEVHCLDSPIGATNVGRTVEPDIVLVDLNLPGCPGDALVPLLRRSVPKHTRILLFSSSDECELRAIASRVGADGSVHKSKLGSSFAQELRSALGASILPGP